MTWKSRVTIIEHFSLSPSTTRMSATGAFVGDALEGGRRSWLTQCYRKAYFASFDAVDHLVRDQHNWTANSRATFPLCRKPTRRQFCTGISGSCRSIIGSPRPLCARLLQRKTFAASGRSWRLLNWLTSTGRHAVDLALRFDVLAVCAVFAFVTAILLGAF
jgi:hypothetical protein